MMSFALKSEPSENFTPARSLNSQVVSSSVFHEAASIGRTIWFSSWSTMRSKMCLVIELLGARLWKCGSIAEGSADSPTFSSCAMPAGAIRSAAIATERPKRVMRCSRSVVFGL
jgi:hypothetical protein